MHTRSNLWYHVIESCFMYLEYKSEKCDQRIPGRACLCAWIDCNSAFYIGITKSWRKQYDYIQSPSKFIITSMYCTVPYRMSQKISPCGFLSFTQKIFRQPIPEISWLSQLLVADTPMKFFLSNNFVYTLWQHFWDTQYKYIFL